MRREAGLSHGQPIGSEDSLLDKPGPHVRPFIVGDNFRRQLRATAGIVRKGICRMVKDDIAPRGNATEDFLRSEVGF